MLPPAPPPALVAIASNLAGTPVSVSCQRNQDFTSGVEAYTLGTQNGDGTITVDPVLHFSRGTCNELIRLVVRDGRPHHAHSWLVTNGGQIVDLPGGSAVHILEHEALHVREQSADEARVECLAEENRATAVGAFHFAAWQAKQILRGFVVAHLDSSRAPVDYLADRTC